MPLQSAAFFNSMAEPVSLAVGLAPIIGGMVKSYKVVHNKFMLFAHANREAHRIRRKLKLQCDVFVNEIEKLLNHVLVDEEDFGDDVLKAMTKDGDHEGWKSPKIDAHLVLYLDRNYESWEGIVQAIAGKVAYLLEEIKAFDGVLAKEDGTVPGEREKLTSRAKVTFDQTKCNRAVQSLRTSNEDLARLCEQVLQLKQPKQAIRTRNSLSPSSTGAHRFRIRKAAGALHQGLSDTLQNRNHDVRLFIQPIIQGEATVTNFVLWCAGEEKLVRDVIQVRSYTAPRLPTPPPESSMEGLRVSEEPQVRGGGVQGPGQLGQPSDTQISAEPNRPGQRRQDRRRPTKNLCLKLCHDRRRNDKRPEDECLCYVETYVAGEAIRHDFHPGNAMYQGTTKLATLESIFVDYPLVRTAMTKRDQLKLARAMVLAVLYFSSTPWLPDDWTLGHLSFFSDRSGNLPASLRTVNLGVTIPGASHATTAEMEDEMLQFGIRNLPLHCLGIVLLQIDRWQLTPADVKLIRRLAQQRSELEADYQDLVEKCLYCEFNVKGDRKNLSRPELWQAVHREVLEKLDEMIDLIDPFAE